MSSTWKVKGRGEYNRETVMSSEYFIKNNCVSCGWGDPAIHNQEYVVDIKSYKEKWKEMYEKHNKKWGYQGIQSLFERVEKGDFLWTRLAGVYYVAQVPDRPENLFYVDLSDDAKKYDCVVQLKNIFWKKIGTEEKVPGSISTYNRNTSAIVKVDSSEELKATSMFSDSVLNNKPIKKINDRNMILRFIGPSGFEDVIALWLYDKFNYVVIPSTNKISTQTYEFVFVDGSRKNNIYNSSKRIYLQAKNGDNNLNLEDYTINHLEDEIWLATSRGKIFNERGELEAEKIIQYTKTNEGYEKRGYRIQELVNFLFDERKKPILPEAIKVWTNFFE